MNRIHGPGANHATNNQSDQEWKIDPVLLHDRYLLEFNQQNRGGKLHSANGQNKQFVRPDDEEWQSHRIAIVELEWRGKQAGLLHTGE
jgi:hypothetical protein